MNKLEGFWNIVETVEGQLTDEEHDRMGFDASSSLGYGLADEFADAIGYIRVKSQGARDNVMRIIHNNVALVPLGLGIRFFNHGDRDWFVVFMPAGL